MEKPKLIYKYESVTKQSLKNLHSRCIYFGSPRNFNDPYDCALNVRIEEPTDQELLGLRARYLTQETPPVARTAIARMANSEFRAYITRAMRSAINDYVSDFLNVKGVTCFSEKNDDLLMWSNYGDACKGFCIEFSTEQEPFHLLHAIKYAQEIPTVNCAAILNGDATFFDSLFCTKSLSWSYEKEWRIMNHEVTQYTYNISALTGVYFGPDIDIESLEIVQNIVVDKNPNVTLWSSQRSKEKFEVVFNQIL